MAERVHPRGGAAANAFDAARTRPDVPSTTDAGPGPIDPHAEGTGGLVARAGGDRGPADGHPADLRRLQRPR